MTDVVAVVAVTLDAILFVLCALVTLTGLGQVLEPKKDYESLAECSERRLTASVVFAVGLAAMWLVDWWWM